MEASSGRRATAASPQLRQREHARDEGHRPRITPCSAAFLSWWPVVVVCVTALPTLCLGQDDSVERAEDGKERGPNSTLAKKAEVRTLHACTVSLPSPYAQICIANLVSRFNLPFAPDMPAQNAVI